MTAAIKDRPGNPPGGALGSGLWALGFKRGADA
jgi:hypothetical protein